VAKLYNIDDNIVDSLPVIGHPGEVCTLHQDGSSPIPYMWDHVTEGWVKFAMEGREVTVKNLHVATGAQLFNDYLVSGNAVLRGTSAPDIAELRNGLFLPAFNGVATTEQAFFTVHVLHDIRNSTNPTFHVHWTHNNASPSGNVKWQIDYSYAHGYELGTYGAPTTLSVVDAAAAQYTHHITDDDEMAVATEMMVDGQMICRIYRDPTDGDDDFADDAFLIGVDMHYEIGQWGTPERNQPFSYGDSV
jgi:hypothetical protein